MRGIRTALLIGLLAVPALAQEGPEIRVNLNNWLPAELAVDEKGEVASFIEWDDVEVLEYQREYFREKFGTASRYRLHNGQVPDEAFCAPPQAVAATLPLESKGNFYATIMLSHVAVTATVHDIAFGFEEESIPAVVVELEDVHALHGYSLTPDYAVIPVGRMVAADSVYCGPVGRGGTPGFSTTAGERVLLVGYWEAGVVRVGLGQSALLATVDTDSQQLIWWFGKGPGTVSGVQNEIDRVLSTGMYEYAENARHAQFLSEERFEIGEDVQDVEDHGCTVSSAVTTDEGWTLRTVCDR